MRNGILALSVIGMMALCNAARADIFEVPLPVTGTYEIHDRRTFQVDFDTEFSEIRDARLYVEGTMVAPLRGPFGNPPYTPIDARFQVALDHASERIFAQGPSVGRDTYPAPEPFSGTASFFQLGPDPIDWDFLLDGRVSGSLSMVHGTVGGNDVVVGGTGILTRASLIVDATVVPEPTAAFLFLSLHPLLRRRPRAVNSAKSDLSRGQSHPS